MAAGQVALAGQETTDAAGRERPDRSDYTVGEAARVGEAAANAAAMPKGWKPSRFFEAWKKEAVKTAGALFWNRMTYHRGFPPNARKEAIDAIIRTTMVHVYGTDDFFEGYCASRNDYDAMEAYAAAFLDAFWEDLWADYRGDRAKPAMSGMGAAHLPGHLDE